MATKIKDIEMNNEQSFARNLLNYISRLNCC